MTTRWVMRPSVSSVVLLASALVVVSDALTISALSRAVSHACEPLEQWPEPEDVAKLCADASAICSTSSASISAPGDQAFVVPPQGEFDFSTLASFDDRFRVVEAPAYEGDVQAMQTLGLLFFGGIGGVPCADERFSAQWHAAAAARGNIDAMATLGGCIRSGVGAEQHEETGLRLIQAAASVGSPVGLVKLGILYDEGASGLAQDSWAAAQCFERGAADGLSALALFNHGWALVHGIGRARDVDEGLRQWDAAAKKAPDDGSEEAAFFLYDERSVMSAAQVKNYRPGSRLRLAASLGYEKAVKELRRRESLREISQIYSEAGGGGAKAQRERFIRNDKARAYTSKELCGEAYLDP
jgi:TPR repeat protein